MADIQNQKTTVREVLAALGHGERVVVAGPIDADLTVEIEQLPYPGEIAVGGPLETLPGGKSANQTMTCALLGTTTSFIGTLGDDAHGDLFYQSLRRAGVDAAGVSRVNQSSGSTLITVDLYGENTIVYSAGVNATLNAASVTTQTEIIRGAQVLGLCLESPLEAAATAAIIAREVGVMMALNFSPITEAPSSLLRLVDVLIVNGHELAVSTDHPLDSGDATGLRAALSDLGLGRAVLTSEMDGALVLEGGEFVSVLSSVVAAVDTTGCGDAFMGSLLAAAVAGESLLRGVCLASAVAGATVLRKGAQAPCRNAHEVREFLDFSRTRDGWGG